ncbi:hypothetical protein [Streptomyces sp. NPDC054765]
MASAIRPGGDIARTAARTDASAPASYVGAVIQGMSPQARDGAERTELAAIAEPALQARLERSSGKAR